MRKTFVGITLLLSAGCSQLPQWNSVERQTVEAEHENAITQIELTGAAGELATIAEEQAATALDYKLSTLSQAERIKLLINQAEWHEGQIVAMPNSWAMVLLLQCSGMDEKNPV